VFIIKNLMAVQEKNGIKTCPKMQLVDVSGSGGVEL
jgi:hypothetical protein